MIDWWRERRAARRANEQLAADTAAFNAALPAWQAQRDALASALVEAEQFRGSSDVDGLVLQDGERAFLSVEGVGLVEERSTPGRWVGRSAGFSVPLGSVGGHAVRYHVGGSSGVFQPGQAEPKVIDRGTVWVTDHRVLFQGEFRTREVLLSRLAAVGVDPDGGLVRLSASNRQLAVVLFVSVEGVPLFESRLDLALAYHSGRVEDLVDELRGALAQVDAARPVAPAGLQAG